MTSDIRPQTLDPATVIATARTLLGVPYAHQGRTLAGLDCIGLLIVVAQRLGLSDFDVRDYDRQPDPATLLRHCEAQLAPKPAGAPLALADVLLLRWDKAAEPAHFALVTDYPPAPAHLAMLHAYSHVKRVTEHRLSDVWRARIARVYTIPGVAA